MNPISEFDEAVEQVLEACGREPGTLLPVLHALQERVGYVPHQAVPAIARALNLSRAEVHGVVSFYHDFRASAPGRHVVRICLAEACRAMGAAGLSRHARASLGVDLHQTTADGAISLEPVYCLGNCACSPAIMVDDDVHGRVDVERFDRIVAGLRSAP